MSYQDNPALAGVNRALGYRDDGTEVAAREGKRVLARRFRMEPNDVPESWPPVMVEGVNDELLHLCGTLDPEGH